MVAGSPGDAGLHAGSDPLARHSATPAELQQLLQAERAATPFLAVRDRTGLLQLHVLDESADRIALGRHPATGVPITWDAEVSGLHAELERVGGEWTITDDGLSRNGTFINGQRVRGRRRLRDGDRVRVGQTVLAVRLTATPVAGHTVVADHDAASYRVSPAQRRVLVALCRPCQRVGSFAAPASNQQIADELYLSTETVKMHLRALFATFQLDHEPQNQKRARLAETALHHGVISPADLV